VICLAATAGASACREQPHSVTSNAAHITIHIFILFFPEQTTIRRW
jgi:hypothetical protein